MSDKPRISTTQLKHLLDNFPVATNESPLIGMYRAMLMDALLDLRDAIGGQERLTWYVRRMDAGLKETKDRLLKMAIREHHPIRRDDHDLLASSLAWADEHPPSDLVKNAIAPLTGKEKP